MIAAAPHTPVQLFTHVTLTEVETGERLRYQIVQPHEARFEEGRLSLASPLGRALLQEYPGNVVSVKTPGGELLYRILRVDP